MLLYQNEARKLGMLNVKNGDFNWPYPRGEWVTGKITMEDFSCEKKVFNFIHTQQNNNLLYILENNNMSKLNKSSKI